MKAEDLRVNNYVIFHDDLLQQDHIVRIVGVCEPFLNCPIQISYENETVKGTLHELDNIHPIQLTEEILLKCGFRKSVNPKVYELRIFQIYKTGDECFFRMVGFTICKIDYLHDLQNLFYALTKTELEIEL